jgi:hypothetical protein
MTVRSGLAVKEEAKGDEMEEQNKEAGSTPQPEELTRLMRGVIDEYLSAQREKTEPAYKVELQEERRRRETLERRLNEVVEENKRNRQAAEEAERHSQIRAELQRLGVSKVDLAFRVVKDDIQRLPDGTLAARTNQGEMSLREYLGGFVQENPEFLPARMTGGTGIQPSARVPAGQTAAIDLDRIKPGMNAEDLQKVREQISNIALQNLRGE